MDNLTQRCNILNDEFLVFYHLILKFSRRWIVFACNKLKLIGSLPKLAHRGSQFMAPIKYLTTTKHVEAQTSTRHSHDQTTHISQVTDGIGPDKRQKDIVVLLTLIVIDR